MNDRADRRLIRYVKVMVPSAAEVARLMAMRRRGGWLGPGWEVELFGTLEGLVRAYTAGALAAPESVVSQVDLAQGRDEVDVILELESASFARRR